MNTNPYSKRLKQSGLTKFRRATLRQRERGWNDYHAGKDILAYYDAPMLPCREEGRANYNVGWRTAKDTTSKTELLAS